MTRHRDYLEELIKERTAALEREVEERRLVEMQLKVACEQTRNLIARVERMREEEREKIVRDIHDDLGQVLTVLSFEISRLDAQLTDDERGLRGTAKEAMRLIDEAMERIHRISAELRPPLLDNLGIVAAMEEHGKEFERKTGIRCTVVSKPEEIRIDRHLSAELFRIFQEALTNAARHAGATMVTVAVHKEEEQLVMKIRDNGKGIRPEDISNVKATGIAGMKVRIRPWGGILAVQGGRRGGTVVSVSITLGQKHK